MSQLPELVPADACAHGLVTDGAGVHLYGSPVWSGWRSQSSLSQGCCDNRQCDEGLAHQPAHGSWSTSVGSDPAASGAV